MTTATQTLPNQRASGLAVREGQGQAEANTAYVANETNEHSPLQKHKGQELAGKSAEKGRGGGHSCRDQEDISCFGQFGREHLSTTRAKNHCLVRNANVLRSEQNEIFIGGGSAQEKGDQKEVQI
eukprot:scaffold9253_cov80-Skeletonema_marinoi.AAC.3